MGIIHRRENSDTGSKVQDATSVQRWSQDSVGSRTPSRQTSELAGCPLRRRLGHCPLISRDRSWDAICCRNLVICWERFMGFYHFVWSQFHTNDVMKAWILMAGSQSVAWPSLPGRPLLFTHSLLCLEASLTPHPQSLPLLLLVSVLMSLPRGNCVPLLHVLCHGL